MGRKARSRAPGISKIDGEVCAVENGAQADAEATPDAEATRLAAQLLESVSVSHNPELSLLRSKYAMLGKAEWWWLFDDSIAQIGKKLAKDSYVVVDEFLPGSAVQSCRRDIERTRQEGRLQLGGLAGGNSGKATIYSLTAVRGDLMGWFSGDEPGLNWDALPSALQKADTFVSELAKVVPELQSVKNRSKCMTTVYPGGSARYIRHVDNPNRNGRKLTVIVYLNPDWRPADGGALRIYRCLGDATGRGFTDCDGNSLDGLQTPEEAFPDDGRAGTGPGPTGGVLERGTAQVPKPGAMAVALTDVAPIGGRLLAFYSDARVPHEVLAAHSERYALTVWYYAEEELLAARSTSADTADTADTAVLADGEPSRLESKIAKEIAAMQSRYGGVATVSKKAPTEGITGGGGAGESGACGESRNAPDQETAREEENEGRGSGAEGSGRTEPAADMGIPHCVGAWAQSADGCSWQLQVHVPLAGQHSAADMDLNLDPLRGVLELTPAPAIPPTRILLPGLPPEGLCAADGGGGRSTAHLEEATVTARFVRKRMELAITIFVVAVPGSMALGSVPDCASSGGS